ncbi:hypothetical protein EDB86DRAFT_2967942 [Lactarius hatsudake]|nr:hypothetical protein EDB86DRAFT_2967942 [Lactarius hatsudake]
MCIFRHTVLLLVSVIPPFFNIVPPSTPTLSALARPSLHPRDPDKRFQRCHCRWMFQAWQYDSRLGGSGLLW